MRPITPPTRRALLAGLGASAAAGFAPPPGLRLARGRRELWRRATGPHLRGAVFVQRRVYSELDGPEFLGPGPLGAPITDRALNSLRDAGANLAVWSGPGPFAERAPFDVDAEIEDHIAHWLERCRAAGLYTVLGFRSGPGRSAFAFHPEENWYPERLHDDSLWREPDKQAAWIAMVEWARIRFGSHPALAGILAMVEPNGDWLGYDTVWPEMTQTLAARWSGEGVPLLLSPDGWADMGGVEVLRAAIGPAPVIAAHTYTPRAYTHQRRQAPVSWNGAELDLPRAERAGDWACLEFGAVNHAPGQGTYLQARIAAFERAGAGWTAFRWTSGWQTYEDHEGTMNLARSPAARRILENVWQKNRRFAR